MLLRKPQLKIELAGLFWNEICTGLFLDPKIKSVQGIVWNSGWIFVTAITLLEVKWLFWQQDMLLNTHISHSLWPNMSWAHYVRRREDNKIPTDIWLTEWFCSLFFKVVTQGICLLAFLISSFNANAERLICPACKIWLIVAKLSKLPWFRNTP